MKTFYEQQVEKIYGQHGLHAYQYAMARQSKKFMEEHYARKIELKEIAAHACMSSFYYIRIFSKIYGLTPRQYLRDLRIHKAKELFKENIIVADVCYAVGYDSLPTFSTAFKRGTGYSPKEYIALHNSNRE